MSEEEIWGKKGRGEILGLAFAGLSNIVTNLYGYGRSLSRVQTQTNLSLIIKTPDREQTKNSAHARARRKLGDLLKIHLPVHFGRFVLIVGCVLKDDLLVDP
jgi:hypothetical protein